MSGPDRLVVDLVELRRHTGTRRPVTAQLVLADTQVGEMSLADGRIDVDLVVEAATEGVVVTGRVSGTSRSPCRRCLEEVDLPLVAEVHEIYETDPTEGETWPIEDERIDLTAMLREAALLALPVSPLCSDDCAGPEPDRFPTGAALEDADEDEKLDPEPKRDPRWAVLDELTFEE